MKNLKLFTRLSAAYKNKAEPEALRSLGESLWRALVSIVAIIVIGSCAFGFWELKSVSANIARAQNQTSGAGGATLNLAKLDSAVQALEDRTNSFDSLAAQPASTSIADPYSD